MAARPRQADRRSKSIRPKPQGNWLSPLQFRREAVEYELETFSFIQIFIYTRPALRNSGIGGAARMNTKQSVKLIKKEERKASRIQARVELPVGPKKWSTSVLSWVNEFQQQRRRESIPAFDSLFKQALTPSATQADTSMAGKGGLVPVEGADE